MKVQIFVINMLYYSNHVHIISNYITSSYHKIIHIIQQHIKRFLENQKYYISCILGAVTYPARIV